MTRLQIRLSEECFSALQVLALQEFRNARQQAAWMIEQELERRGLLESESEQITYSSINNPKKMGKSQEELKYQRGADVTD
jgi:hypothetical protein